MFLAVMPPPALSQLRPAWSEVGTFLQRREGNRLSKLTVFVDLPSLRRQVKGEAKGDPARLRTRIAQALMRQAVPLRVRQELMLDIGPKARRELVVAALRRGDSELDLNHPVCAAFLDFWSHAYNLGDRVELEFLDARTLRAQGPLGGWHTEADPGLGRATMRAYFGEACLDAALKAECLEALAKLAQAP